MLRSLACLALCACGDVATAPPVLDVTASIDARFDPSFRATRREPRPPITIRSLVASGTYWRVITAHGPVHVWIPRGYNAKRAETVVYVHGYYVHVDDAWEDYDLASQFASSAIDAMFIAPEAPAAFDERVAWDSISALLAAVEKLIAQPVPKRRVVAFGHSAAYRTLLGWLDEPALDTVVLLDAAYGEIEQYKKWIESSEDHRLIDIGDASTRQWTDQLHALLPDTVEVDGFPDLDEGWPKNIQRARIVYIKSDLGHFPLVTNGTTIPQVLRALRARKVLRKPLAEILQAP